jgi:Xaa-Pro aminopeptidase
MSLVNEVVVLSEPDLMCIAGMMEYQLEAEFRRSAAYTGCLHVGYPSIVGSGKDVGYPRIVGSEQVLKHFTLRTIWI